MLYEKREKFDEIGKGVGRVFKKTGLTPNQLTCLSVISALISFYFLLADDFLAASAFFALMAVLDVADGSVAKITKTATKKGAYYDTMTDRYNEFIIIAGLFFAGMPSFMFPAEFWLLFYLFGSTMTTYAKAAAREKNLVSRELKGGLLERGERMILLFVGILLASISRIYFAYVIIILAVLSNITAFQRMQKAVE